MNEIETSLLDKIITSCKANSKELDSRPNDLDSSVEDKEFNNEDKKCSNEVSFSIFKIVK